MKTVGERIKKIRHETGLSQTEFGKKIGLGRDVIGNIECNRVEIKEYILKLICFSYKINEKWIRTGEGDMYQIPHGESVLDEILIDATIDDTNKIKEIVSGLSLLDEKYIDAIITLIQGLKK